MRYLTAFIATAALAAASCIENDIPYPLVELRIEGIEGEGFTVAEIDASAQRVTLALDEQTDIRHVVITGATLGATPHGTNITAEEFVGRIRTSQPLSGTFDLRTPLYVTLSVYQDYAWTIRAEQTIERRFEVAGQVGATLFDTENRIATAFVAKDADRSKVSVTALKLGPADITTYDPTAEELSTMDFSAPEGSDPASGTPRFVDVTAHGRTERWMLYVLPTDKSVKLDAADAWSKVVHLRGSGIEGVAAGFRVSTAAAPAATPPEEGAWGPWSEVEGVASDGGTFRARYAAEPETWYRFVAYCGEEESAPATVRTDGVAQLPNAGLEAWCTIAASNNYQVVYPYAEGDTPFWGTGNVGASVAKETLTDKLAEPRPGSEGQYCAHLSSKFANIAGIGKFAAGNLFTGTYVRNAVTDGIITFGRSFTLRPTKLGFWFRYRQGLIDKVKGVPAGESVAAGDPDTGIVYIMLGTWTPEEYGKDSEGKQVGTADSPYCIDTRDAGTFLKRNGKDVVAYGELVMDRSYDEWTHHEIEIEYVATDIRPTHVMIVCSASRLGDYFTGSTKSELWVDDLELIYE